MTEWRDQAACLTTDPETFFPDLSDIRGALAAKAICDTCRVADECLTYAIRTRQHDGIWGGVSPHGRRRIGGQKGCKECNTNVPPGFQYCEPCGLERRGRQAS